MEHIVWFTFLLLCVPVSKSLPLNERCPYQGGCDIEYDDYSIAFTETIYVNLDGSFPAKNPNFRQRPHFLWIFGYGQVGNNDLVGNLSGLALDGFDIIADHAFRQSSNSLKLLELYGSFTQLPPALIDLNYIEDLTIWSQIDYSNMNQTIIRKLGKTVKSLSFDFTLYHATTMSWLNHFQILEKLFIDGWDQKLSTFSIQTFPLSLTELLLFGTCPDTLDMLQNSSKNPISTLQSLTVHFEEHNTRLLTNYTLFTSNRNLKALEISNTTLDLMPSWLDNLPKLENITLRNSVVNFLKLNESYISVKNVNLVAVSLYNIPAQLDHFTNLESLWIESSFDLEVRNLSLFRNIKSSLKSFLVIGPKYVNPLAFEDFRNLQELFLYNANVDDHKKVEAALKNTKTTLKELVVSGNRLTQMPDLHDMNSLRYLDLSRNVIQDTINITFPGTLLNLHLRGNELTYIPQSLMNSFKLKELNLSLNKIKSIDNFVFSSNRD